MKQKPSSSQSLIIKFQLLVGIMLLLALYFWGHNVGQSAFNLAHGFTAVFRSVLDLLMVALLVAIGGGIGRRVMGYFVQGTLHPDVLNKAETAPLQAGLGLGLISVGALFMGLIGLYSRLMWLVLLLVAGLTYRQIFDWLYDCRVMLSRALQPETAWERFIVVFTAGLLIAAFVLALAPPFGWDAMTYHIEGPHRYIQAGRIAAQPDNHFLGFPQGVEMLYGLLILPLGSDSTPALLHFAFGLLGLMATAGLVRRYSDTTTAYTCVLLLLTSLSIWLLFGWPYVDLAVLCYGALALIAITRWNSEKTHSWLILSGILAGMALGIKYTGASLIVALSIFILMRQPRQVIRNGLIFGLSVFVAFLPWMVKGWLLYQNPIYPYIFGGLNWDSLRAANFGGSGHGLLSSNLSWHLPILPFAATIFGVEKVSPPPYAFTTGPWLLTLPFALLIGWKALDDKARTLARDLVLIGLVLLLFWILLASVSDIGSQPRLMLVGAPVAAILGALGLQSIARLPRKPLDIYFIVQGVIIFSVLIGLFDVVHEFAKTRVLDYSAGTISEDLYLQTSLGYYYPALRHLSELPAGSIVQFMWEPKTYYCPDIITCIPDALFDNWSRPIMQGIEPDALMQQWRDAGVDYLLVYGLHTEYNVGYDFWLNQHEFAHNANSRFPHTLDETMIRIWDDGFAYALYKWKE